MQDLRLNWEVAVARRIQAVITLAHELGWDKTAERAAHFDPAHQDGQYFRRDFTKSGGFLKPPWRVPRTLKGTSPAFQQTAADLLLFPDFFFKDYAAPAASPGRRAHPFQARRTPAPAPRP
jgi:hypothetical protein